MSISVYNVTKLYDKQKALNDVNFSLEGGEICGFMGPNGAGKSTMMKIITGYLKDYEGEVYINNVNVRKSPIEAKKMIGYLPEHNPLYPEMYIKEYLAYVCRLYRIKNIKERVEEMVHLTGLLPEIGKQIGQLSKGFRQRVGLAQALIHDPEVLILDEPMTGLDPNQLSEIRELITRVGKNKTILLSTHIMQEVEAICNRVIIINRGNIIADKPIESLNEKTGDKTLIKVRFSEETDGVWLSDIKTVQNVEKLSATTFLLEPIEGEDPRVELFNKAAQYGHPIIELKVEEQNLEQIFRELTHR